MEVEKKTQLDATPPKLIASVKAGFDAVANNVQLILMPVLLDLFLWFGPRLRLKTLFEPYIQQATQQLLEVGPPDMVEMVDISKEIWVTFLSQYSLFSILRTFPIGVSSLVASQWINQTPLGDIQIIEINSFFMIFAYIILFIFIGLISGSLYFNEVERFSHEEYRSFSIQQAVWQTLQTFLLTAALFFVLILFTIPTIIVVSMVALLSPVVAQIAFFVAMLIFIWILLPLFFSPHGIFASQQNAILSMITSVRLVRFFLPGTGLFVLVILIISQGLDVIWRVPPATSWLMLVGIAGHAFITTSLLAASFIYYRGGMLWMRINLEHIDKTKNST